MYIVIVFITKEADYAVRIIRALSRMGRENVRHICGSEQIPHQYAYKILKKLEKAGIVLSYRGVDGGYALVKDPRLITLFDVITAVDGDLLLCECLGHGADCPMNGKGSRRCKVHGEFSRIQVLILKHLREKSLAEIF
ncbi:MAG: Rrf2 family transcriptional regulator [Treponema sp.]|nr:Rrf2 family transcriptional regulator [Treponema sp.]